MDINKKTCAQCSKEDCERCVEKAGLPAGQAGKSFCCQNCCSEHEKNKGEQKKNEPTNVCRFC